MSKWWLLEKKSKAKWNRYHILISLLRGRVLRAFKNIIIWKIVIVKEKNWVFSHSSIILKWYYQGYHYTTQIFTLDREYIHTFQFVNSKDSWGRFIRNILW